MTAPRQTLPVQESAIHRPPTRQPRIQGTRIQETPIRLRTADHVDLHALLLEAGDRRLLEAGDRRTGVVLAPGFSGHSGRPDVLRVARAMARYATVLCLDLRGHGRSAGRSTLGDREPLDVDVAVAQLRERGVEQVVTCGWSMGGSAVIRHAGLIGDPVHGHVLQQRPDAVVSVSGTSRWFVRDTTPMRRLHWLVMTRLGRRVARGVFAVRIDPRGWVPVPASPVEVVGRIAPVPLLIVHGDQDAYFTMEHPRPLLAAAGPSAQLWEVPGFGHAENAADAALLERIGRHLAEMLAVPTTPAGSVVPVVPTGSVLPAVPSGGSE